MNRHQTAVAAEAFAAGVFAQAECSVFVQYGANQPGYDLVVADDVRTMRVNVKGSTNGGWLFTTKDKNGTWEQALDEWIEHNRDFVFCLVQFDRVPVGQLPNMYLATGKEIETELRRHWFGEEISLSLNENYAPKKGPHKGKVSCIPANWRMTKERICAVICQNSEQHASFGLSLTEEPQQEAFTKTEQDYLLREAGKCAGWDDPANDIYNDLDPRKKP